MTRPPSLSKPSAAAVRRRNNRVNTVLFKRKLVKGWLRSAGRKHAITMKAFRTVTTMGQQLFDRLVNTVVCELSRNIKNNKTTIKTRHIIHSANILNTSSELVEAALEMKKSKRYDVSAFKKSAVRRSIARLCPKHRVSTQAVEFLWCIVILHLEEIIQYNTDLVKPGSSIRIKEENVFNAIHAHGDGVLDSMQNFIGSGISLSSSNV